MRALVATPAATEPKITELPDPLAGPDDVVVQVIAAAVNPVDQMVAGGAARQAFGLDGAVGLGWDVSGRIVAVGDKVTDLRVGDVVAGLHVDLAAPSRTHAERVALPASAIAALPAGLDVVAAASVPLNSLTAAQALELMGTPQGRQVLITGAAGAVGGYAVALALAAGWRVAGLARGGDAEFLNDIGDVELVIELDGRSRWDVVLDTATLGRAALAATADDGRYVGVLPAFPLQPERGVVVQDIAVTADGATLAGLLERSRLGELKVRVAGTTSFEDAPAAYATVAAGGQRGRWLLLP